MDSTKGKEGGFLVRAISTNRPRLETRSLYAEYGEISALKDISLQVAPGEILGVIGPNGAGKSTLIRVLSGILRAAKGEVLLDNQNITQYTPNQRARLIAVVPQARQLGGAFTVEQTVLLGRTAHLGFLGRASTKDKDRVDWAMEQTRVKSIAKRHLAEISGGEQQRVLLARAMAQETPVLLLDEPTNHLDLRYQVNLLELLKELVVSQKLSVIMAMHDLNQVSGTADRVALLVNGKLHCIGKPSHVLTPSNIQDAYQTQVNTIRLPDSNRLIIYPVS
jgi:iron complex transport system ATP-binding protein